MTNEMIARANELADQIEVAEDDVTYAALMAEFDAVTDALADVMGREAMCDAVRCPEA